MPQTFLSCYGTCIDKLHTKFSTELDDTVFSVGDCVCACTHPPVIDKHVRTDECSETPS